MVITAGCERLREGSDVDARRDFAGEAFRVGFESADSMVSLIWPLAGGHYRTMNRVSSTLKCRGLFSCCLLYRVGTTRGVMRRLRRLGKPRFYGPESPRRLHALQDFGVAQRVVAGLGAFEDAVDHFVVHRKTVA